MSGYLNYVINHSKQFSIVRINNESVEVQLGDERFLIKAGFIDDGLFLPHIRFHRLNIIQIS